MKIGFDLWGTLIQANPQFRERKKDLYQKYFGRIEGCEEILQEIKKSLNNIIEHTGWQPSEEIIHRMIASKMYSDLKTVEKFMEDYQRLGIVYSPQLISSDIITVLTELSNAGNDLYIVSNTMFFNHKTMKTIVSNIGLDEFFTWSTFSDERGIAKPDPRIYNEDLDYFIGDNPMTDGFYAEKIEAEFIHINTNDKTIQDVLSIIN